MGQQLATGYAVIGASAFTRSLVRGLSSFAPAIPPLPHPRRSWPRHSRHGTPAAPAASRRCVALPALLPRIGRTQGGPAPAAAWLRGR